MLMKNLASGHLIEVEQLADLTNPFSTIVAGRELWGQELQEPDDFRKAELGFPSGESLPQSWIDPDYMAHSQPHNTQPGAGDPGVPEAERAGYQGA